MNLLIADVALLTPEESWTRGALWLADGRIAAAGPVEGGPAPSATARIDGRGLTAAPGFVDCQVNGGFGHDFTADPTTLWAVAARLPRFGVTAFLPTLVTSPPTVLAEARAVLAAGPPPGFRGARPLGWHVEGPFLNPAKRGAHHPAHLRPLGLTDVADWTPAGGVRMVTLAPELPGARDVIARLVAAGVVVSLGHSLADVDTARDALDAGARAGTHLFNAMPPLHHRRPGLAGALLTDERAIVGLIADGRHVAAPLLQIAWRTLGPARLMLVSDAMAALGMPAGDYTLGDQRVRVGPDGAHLADGTIAGSVAGLDEALRCLRRAAGLSLAEALPAATTTPAALLGESERLGRLRPDAPADVVLLDEAGRVRRTIVGGEIVYEAGEGEVDA